MRVHTEWLRELVPVEVSTTEVAETLTRLGLEVERFVDLPKALRDIRMGEIVEKVAHPAARDMYVCQVSLGELGQCQIVCASEHPIEVGWRVPIAPPNTTLPTGIHVKQDKYRGQISQGMICLDREMGILPSGTGLQVGTDPLRPGTPLVECVDIRGALIDVAVLPNRPDCMGLVGIAREVAAAYGVDLREPTASGGKADSTGSCPVPVVIEDEQSCPRYTGRVIRGVSVKRSPMWLSSRLVLAGFRPINSVVDITNLVLFEWGHPLHAFDLAKLHGPSIAVRHARDGESILLLDGTTLELHGEELVIADEKRPVALAGIMGGAETGVTETTTDVLLEAAFFDPVVIRRTARSKGIRTESSNRFERRVDPNTGLVAASRRAVELIVEVCGGAMDGGVQDVYPTPIAARRIALSAEVVNATLGTSLESADMELTLGRLGMTMLDGGEVSVPTWRADVNDAVVLVEDIARHSGYDAIPMRGPQKHTPVRRASALATLRRVLRTLLIDLGLWEARTLSLEHSERLGPFGAADRSFARVSNPIGVELDVVRDAFFPRLLDVVQHNDRRNRSPLRFFEIDRSFRRSDAIDETWIAAGAVAGPALDRHWRGKAPAIDFFWLKGLLENALLRLGFSTSEVRFERCGRSYLSAREAASLVLADEPVGFLGRLQPEIQAQWEIRPTTYLFELDLSRLAHLQGQQPRRRFRELPKHPSVLRDLSFLVPDAVDCADIEAEIRAVGGGLVESIVCYDAWAPDSKDGGKPSLTFSIAYRARDETLTSETVAEIEDRIVRALASKGVDLRGG